MVEFPREVIWDDNLCGKVLTIVQIINVDNSIINYQQYKFIYFNEISQFLSFKEFIHLNSIFDLIDTKLITFSYFSSNISRICCVILFFSFLILVIFVFLHFFPNHFQQKLVNFIDLKESNFCFIDFSFISFFVLFIFYLFHLIFFLFHSVKSKIIMRTLCFSNREFQCCTSYITQTTQHRKQVRAKQCV